MAPPPSQKKVFLKRGQGTSRFEQGGMADARRDYVSRHNITPTAAPREVWNPGSAPAAAEAFSRAGAARAGAAWVVGDGLIDDPTISIAVPSRPPPNSAPPRGPDPSLAEFEALEVAVQQQAEDLAAAAGLEPSALRSDVRSRGEMLAMIEGAADSHSSSSAVFASDGDGFSGGGTPSAPPPAHGHESTPPPGAYSAAVMDDDWLDGYASSLLPLAMSIP